MYHIILLLAMTAGVCLLSADPQKNLPIPTGPFQVGIVKQDLFDASRKEVKHPEGRLVPIQIYFPMARGYHVLCPKLFEERAPKVWPPLQVNVYAHKADLSQLYKDMKHPIILLNHGDTVAMTDYAFIAEDLASHGYVVVAMQHQLDTDPEEPKFWKERSCSRYGKIIDNNLFVFEWLKDNQATLFNGRLDLQRVGFVGHSMGGNALLLLSHRASSSLKKRCDTLLSRKERTAVKEAIIVLDPGGFPFPSHSQYPLFLLLSEEREADQKKSGAYDEMIRLGHKVRYYKGSKHISFMDHGYVNPKNPFNAGEHYFNGSFKYRRAFVDQVRKDIRQFLQEHGI